MKKLRSLRSMLVLAACIAPATLAPATAHASDTKCGYWDRNDTCIAVAGEGMRVESVQGRSTLSSCTASGTYTFQIRILDNTPSITPVGMPGGATVWKSPEHVVTHRQDPVRCHGGWKYRILSPNYSISQTFPTTVKNACILVFKGTGTSRTFVKAACVGIHS